ncbi:hypothetical protein GGX14DRAFT_383778 [Mycena pura]|uniref:Uncharacterized protein n=1 Tax=Mycena pura TaxID=153505 RepID=A0AAD7E5C3_9AGAR|nr:hypothetical protein GGX14DRAFT_383778 [Mycena pura]
MVRCAALMYLLVLVFVSAAVVLVPVPRLAEDLSPPNVSPHASACQPWSSAVDTVLRVAHSADWMSTFCAGGDAASRNVECDAAQRVRRDVPRIMAALSGSWHTASSRRWFATIWRSRSYAGYVPRSTSSPPSTPTSVRYSDGPQCATTAAHVACVRTAAKRLSLRDLRGAADMCQVGSQWNGKGDQGAARSRGSTVKNHAEGAAAMAARRVENSVAVLCARAATTARATAGTEAARRRRQSRPENWTEKHEKRPGSEDSSGGVASLLDVRVMAGSGPLRRQERKEAGWRRARGSTRKAGARCGRGKRAGDQERNGIEEGEATRHRGTSTSTPWCARPAVQMKGPGQRPLEPVDDSGHAQGEEERRAVRHPRRSCPTLRRGCWKAGIRLQRVSKEAAATPAGSRRPTVTLLGGSRDPDSGLGDPRRGSSYARA